MITKTIKAELIGVIVEIIYPNERWICRNRQLDSAKNFVPVNVTLCINLGCSQLKELEPDQKGYRDDPIYRCLQQKEGDLKTDPNRHIWDKLELRES